MNSPGNRLKETRKNLGLNQEEFAEKVGVKTHNIGDVERGKQKLSLELAQQIAEVFNVDWVWLLTGENREEK